MMDERRSILFAIPSLDRDGPDRVMFELLSGLDRKRFRPSLLVSEPDGHYFRRLPADVDVIVLGTQRSLRARYPLLSALRAVHRVRPSVVFSTLRMNLTLGFVSPAFPRGTRFVVRQANDFSTDFRLMVARSPIKQRVARVLAAHLLGRADEIVCQSELMRDDLRRVLGERPRLTVIGNPVDVDATQRAAAAMQLALPGRPSLISVGRLMPQKGFDLLLRAIALVRGEYPDLHLTILGDGPLRAELEAQSAGLDLERSVSFLGFSTQVLPFVSAADLFVLASRYEGFPNAALEALALGIPVVLTDCPGANRQIVLPGINGRLAEVVDAPAVARALANAIDECPRYDRAAISRDIRERFSREKIVRAYEQVLAREVA